MEDIRTTDTITLTLDTGDGATAPILIFPKGRLATDGSKASWFAVQVVDDYKFRLYRINDYRGQNVTQNHKNFTINNQFEKLDTLSYCNRLTADKICNIFQQTGSPKLWVYVEFNWGEGTVARELNLSHPGDASEIDFFSKYKNHLYYRVIDASGDWYLYYIDLDNQPNFGTIVAPDFIYALENDMSEFVTGQDWFYLYTDNAGSPQLQIYPTADATMTMDRSVDDPLAGDPALFYPASLHLINEDSDTLFLRKRKSSLYRIEGEVSTRLNNDLPADTTPYFRIQTVGDLYVEAEEITITANEEDNWKDTWYVDKLAPVEPEPLDDVVTDMCARAGIDSGDIDVTSLAAKEVDGYVIDTITTQRNNLETLRVAYFFDIVDGEKLKFTARGQAAVGALNSYDVGAYIGDEKYSHLIDHNRDSKQDLPAKIAVRHRNQSLDYDESVQVFQSILAANKETQNLDLQALSLTPDNAKQIAHTTFNVLQSEIDKFTFSMPVNNLKFEPGDIVTLTLNNIDYTFRIVSITYYPPLLLTYQCVAEDTENYTSNLEGISGDETESGVDYPEDTLLEVLDIPILLAAHNTQDFIPLYFTAMPAVAGGYWEASNVLRSEDAVNYESIATLTEASVMGYAEDVLADGITTLIDRVSTVTVQLYNTSDTLSSISEANLRTLQYNIALIGSEIVAFQTVVDNTGGNYILSNFIRGLFGTEWATGTHSRQDRFIIIDTDTIVLYSDVLANLDEYRYYAPLTLGQELDTEEIEPELIQNTAVSLTPYAPVVLHADKQSNNDIILQFERRDRQPRCSYLAWQSYRDFPLSEEDATYEVDIYDGSTVVRTITGSFIDTLATVTYTEAQQTTDFGGSQTSIKAYFYQMSAVVGRGYGTLLEKSF